MTDPLLDALAAYDTAYNVGLAVVGVSIVLAVAVILAAAIGRNGFV